MNKIGVVAFGITTCVLVPTALHLLHAGPNQVAKLLAPDETSIRIGDARVDVSADKAIIDAGGKVNITVTATSEKRTKVRLALIVLESEGSGGGRVELPPERITHDELTLDIKDGKATQTVSYTLRGYRGQEMGGPDAFGHYTILVMPPKAADALDKLRRRADRVAEPMDDSTGAYNSFEEAYGALGTADSKLGGPDEVARIDVNTRSKDGSVSIIAADTARSGDDIAVKVRVKNPTKFPISEVALELHAKPYELVGDYKGIAEEAVTIDGDGTQTVSLAAHEAQEVTFHVHTKASGTLGLYAVARCTGDDCYAENSARPRGSEIDDSALDAIDVMPVDEKTPSVAEAQPEAAQPAAAQPQPAAAQPQPVVAQPQPQPAVAQAQAQAEPKQ